MKKTTQLVVVVVDVIVCIAIYPHRVQLILGEYPVL